MRLLATVVLTGLLAGCTVNGSDPTPEPASSSPAAPEESDPAATPACAEVRAGIEAFNLGDFDETVEHFEAAVPLAEDQVDGSRRADLLLEAVRWYADLPAGEYLEASRTSREFERYKQITLGQCVPPGESPDTTDVST